VSFRGRRLRVFFATVVLLFYSAVLAAASLTPVSPDSTIAATGARRAFNNLLHIPAYGLLALMWSVQLRACSARPRAGDLVLKGAAAAVAFGGALELAQLAVHGRSASLMDFVLNALGAGAMAWILCKCPGAASAGTEGAAGVGQRTCRPGADGANGT